MGSKVIRMRKFVRAIPGHGYELELYVVKPNGTTLITTQIVAIEKTKIRSNGKHYEIHEQGTWWTLDEAIFNQNAQTTQTA